MNMFNFGISSDNVVSNSSSYLKPWDIYEVAFDGCEMSSGTRKDGGEWKALTLKFKGEDGSFKKMLFIPDVNNSRDITRPEFPQQNGGTTTAPSNGEEFLGVLTQTIYVLNQAGFNKMQELSPKFKSFEEVVNVFMKLMEKAVGTKTKIKLVGTKPNAEGRVYADIPKIKRISKEGEIYTANTYIGDKLFFSDYEEGERAKYLNRKPTDMSKKVDDLVDVSGIDSTANDISVDDLLADI